MKLKDFTDNLMNLWKDQDCPIWSLEQIMNEAHKSSHRLLQAAGWKSVGMAYIKLGPQEKRELMVQVQEQMKHYIEEVAPMELHQLIELGASAYLIKNLQNRINRWK